MIEKDESIVPVFPCSSLTQTVDFYQSLGFEVTYHQEDPYPYAVIQRGGVALHFSKLTTWHTKNSVYLVMVPEVGPYHREFANALRTKCGTVPTAGLPRITRLQKTQTRFHVFDPSGNVLLYINRVEPEMDYTWYEQKKSKLAAAIDNAVFLRDTYVNDKAAALVLDKALGRKDAIDTIERTRALGLRAELAVAMADERARAMRLELKGILLSDEDRARFRDELRWLTHSADDLERWLTHSA